MDSAWTKSMAWGTSSAPKFKNCRCQGIMSTQINNLNSDRALNLDKDLSQDLNFKEVKEDKVGFKEDKAGFKEDMANHSR